MALMTMMNIATPQFMALVLFAVYIAVGNELTLAKTFTVISLIQQLRIAIKITPFAVMLAIGSHVGCKRLDNLFESTEKETLQLENEVFMKPKEKFLKAENESEAKIEDDDVVISMKNASFKWTETNNDNSDPEKEHKMDESGTNEIKLVVHRTNDDFLLKDLTFKV